MRSYEVEYMVAGKVSVEAGSPEEAGKRAQSLNQDRLLEGLDWETLKFNGAFEAEVGGEGG
jgi:hypothetical protein